MAETIRVLLADDHPLVRAGIRAILMSEADVTLIGEAIDGHQAQRMSQDLQPDVLLLDLNMPGPPPMDMVAYMRTHCPTVKVLVLTAHDDDAYVRGLITAGVAGYVLKDEAIEVVVQAIRAVARGGTWFSQPIVTKLVRWKSGALMPSDSATLTDRELDVLRLVVAGKTDQEIGRQLGIAERTVRYC